MRLFIAINFSARTKEQLIRLQSQLKPRMVKGRLTSPEHLHLTLVFIGETVRTGPLKEALNRVAEPPFVLKFGSLAGFQNQQSELLYLSVERQPPLLRIQRRLAMELQEKGYHLDDKPFLPHITLAREVVWTPGLEPTVRAAESEGGLGERRILMPGLPVVRPEPVGHITLMKSEQLKGRLTYTEIYGKDLRG